MALTCRNVANDPKRTLVDAALNPPAEPLRRRLCGGRCSAPSAYGVHFFRRRVSMLLFGAGRAVDVTSDRQQRSICLRIFERLIETRLVAQCPLSALQPCIDLASFVIGKINCRNPPYAALQKVKVALRRQIHAGIHVSFALSSNIDFPEPLDVDHAFDVENSHFFIPSECRRPRWATFRNAVVEKLIMDPLPAYQRPHKEQLRHAGISLNVLGQDILNGFVPTDLQSARPGALNGHFWWRDHKEHVDEITKAGQQTA